MTKITLEETNPAITVNIDVAESSLEYFADRYATIRLTIKPTKPESSKFLFSDMVLA
jgi:hypothetical protein